MLDKIDQHILNLLKHNARLSNAEIAKRVNLSPTPCLRRIKRLEDRGHIKGYRTQIDLYPDRDSVGALVSVKLAQNSLAFAEEFEAAVRQLEAVSQCFTVSGVYDYVLIVSAASLSDLERVLKKDLGRIESIQDMASTIILNQIKD